MGVCDGVRDGYASVILRGYAEFTYEGQQPVIGFVKLMCTADGGVKVDNEFGRNVMVVAIDTANKKIGVIL